MAQKVAIIDCGSGNLRSVQKAFERAAREDEIAAEIAVTANAQDILAADRLVLPGVGAFGACKSGLFALPGVVSALEDVVLNKARPFLGICVGMQLLADRGLEFGETPGLGWIPGDVRKIKADNPEIKIPHIGWNTITIENQHPLFEGVDSADVYFVHSFCFDVESKTNVVASCLHGEAFTAAVAHKNICGVQFHPEKSQEVGLALLRRFLSWKP